MKKGFSLIEVLVVVAIAASVVIVVGNFGNNITGLNSLITVELGAKSGTSQILQIMTSEIRSAAPSAAGAYPIDSVSSSSITFYSDIYKSGTTAHIRYFYASSTIYKGVIVPTGTPGIYETSSEKIQAVEQNVIIVSGTPLFSYYDSSYTGSQSPLSYPITVSAIRLVGIQFETQANQTSSVNASPIQHFSEIIDLRNLDSN